MAAVEWEKRRRQCPPQEWVAAPRRRDIAVIASDCAIGGGEEAAPFLSLLRRLYNGSFFVVEGMERSPHNPLRFHETDNLPPEV